MMKNLFALFRSLSPEDIAAQELKDARLACLVALTNFEHASSVVDFRTAQVARLERFLIQKR